MQFDCYKIHEIAPRIVPGAPQRDWMDAFPDRQPYRCLPLTMANSTGWEILCPFDLEITWDGGAANSVITLSSLQHPKGVASFADSHFRRGIVTFHTGHLFRTSPGWGVWSSGSPNHFKHGIAPLTGLVETDWLPFPFTMNWQMTAPGTVRFEKDEPFCFITLLEHGRLEQVEPQLRRLDDNAELKQDYEAWRDSRADFNSRLAKGDDAARKQRWQRHYMRGETHSGETADEHRSRRRLKAPRS